MTVPHAGLSFEVYYPMFHPEFNDLKIEKPVETIWVGIPGSVEYKRRDYESLVKIFATVKNKPNIRFIILGNGNHQFGNGKDLKRLVSKYDLKQYFMFFQGFVPNNVFHNYIQKCDILMPLIHPINADMGKYLENQISGTFNMAFAYKLPLLIHDIYQRYNDFRENGIFYNLDNMHIALERLPELIKRKQPDLYQNPKWGFEYQADKFIDFVES
jgi:hypothetical protein